MLFDAMLTLRHYLPRYDVIMSYIVYAMMLPDRCCHYAADATP